jgi:hypothetical protein
LVPQTALVPQPRVEGLDLHYVAPRQRVRSDFYLYLARVDVSGCLISPISLSIGS